MYQSNLYFDEMNATGNKIRLKNKMKAKNLMLLAVSFVDEGILSKIQKIFLDLTPEEMEGLKEYLEKREYLSAGPAHSTREQKILGKVVNAALSSTPKDKYLAEIMAEYNKNLNIIDDLKVKTTKTCNVLETRELIDQINHYNDRNVDLIEKVNQYREKAGDVPEAEEV